MAERSKISLAKSWKAESTYREDSDWLKQRTQRQINWLQGKGRRQHHWMETRAEVGLAGQVGDELLIG